MDFLVFNRFTKEDWYSWAGAESFDHDVPPVIAYNGDDCRVIIDANCVQVYYREGDEAWLHNKGQMGLALRIGFTRDTLKSLGFERVN